jgi:hypothetical protein
VALDADSELWGEAILTVLPGGAPGRHGGRRGTVPDWALAADLSRVLTRRAERAGGFRAALAKVPEAEQLTWRQLWAEVEQVLERLPGPTTPKGNPDGPLTPDN